MNIFFYCLIRLAYVFFSVSFFPTLHSDPAINLLKHCGHSVPVCLISLIGIDVHENAHPNNIWLGSHSAYTSHLTHIFSTWKIIVVADSSYIFVFSLCLSISSVYFIIDSLFGWYERAAFICIRSVRNDIRVNRHLFRYLFSSSSHLTVQFCVFFFFFFFSDFHSLLVMLLCFGIVGGSWWSVYRVRVHVLLCLCECLQYIYHYLCARIFCGHYYCWAFNFWHMASK